MLFRCRIRCPKAYLLPYLPIQYKMQSNLFQPQGVIVAWPILILARVAQKWVGLLGVRKPPVGGVKRDQMLGKPICVVKRTPLIGEMRYPYRKAFSLTCKEDLWKNS